MNIWKILGISATADKSEIKKAYRAKLRVTHPEDNPQEFMQLREAYESALEYAENNAQPIENDILEEFSLEAYTDEDEIIFDDENDDDDEDDEENDDSGRSYVRVDPRKSKEWQIEIKVRRWWDKMSLMLSDFSRRNDVAQWDELLRGDIPYQIVYFDKCREHVREYLFRNNQLRRYFPESVLKYIDGFFSFSPNEYEITDYSERSINCKMKCSEFVDFDKMIVQSNIDFDSFFTDYEYLVEHCIMYGDKMEREERSNLNKQPVTYLPFECFKVIEKLESGKDVSRDVKKLTSLFGECDDILLLNARIMLENGEDETARELLTELYQRAPLKNMPYLYRLYKCCEKAEMYFEAYMAVKQIAYLCSEHRAERYAEKLYQLMEERYTQKLSENLSVSDEEKVEMCRIYLRSSRERDAEKILSEVSEQGRCGWKYLVAACLVDFNSENSAPDFKAYEELQKADKSELSPIDLLEWKEIQIRCLYEQKKYEECIEQCSILLNEYPSSAVILLLRAYADCNLSTTEREKLYLDLEYLTVILPERAEVILLLLKGMIDYNESGIIQGYSKERLLRLIRPLEKKRYEAYEAARILVFGDLNFWRTAYSDERKVEYLKLLKHIEKNGSLLPQISRHKHFDLDLIYQKMSYSLQFSDNEKLDAEMKKALEKRIKALPDGVRKYARQGMFYNDIKRTNDSIKYILKAMKCSDHDVDLKIGYEILVDNYAALGEYHKIKPVADKWLAIDDNAANRIFVLCAWSLCTTDEKVLSALEEYSATYAKNWHTLNGCGAIYMFYDRLALLTGDKSKCLKGAKLLETFPLYFGNIGYDGSNKNNWLSVADLYAVCGMREKAQECVDNFYKYAKCQNDIARNYTYLGTVYKSMGEYEKAIECQLKAKETGVNVDTQMLGGYMYMGDYQKVLDYYETLLDEDEKLCEEPFSNRIKYMMTGEFDKEGALCVIKGIERELKKDMELDDTDSIGVDYLNMADTYYHLGDTEKMNEYLTKANELNWDSLAYKEAAYLRFNLWILWYQKKYSEMKELINSSRKALAYGLIDIEMFVIILEKMGI